MVHIKRLQEDGTDIIAVIGEIDASSSIELDLAIAKSVGEGFRKILVDCSSLEYISSAGRLYVVHRRVQGQKRDDGAFWDEGESSEHIFDPGVSRAPAYP